MQHPNCTGRYVSADKGKSASLDLARRRLLGHCGILDLEVSAQTSEVIQVLAPAKSQLPNVELWEQLATSTMHSGTWLAFGNLKF